MSITWRDGRPVVEVYDPATKRKVHVKPRDYGMVPLPAGASDQKLRRWAQALERAAVNARDARRPGHHDESCRSFATRWPDDYRRGRKGRLRSDSTTEHNRERVKAFGVAFADRTLRSIARPEARTWANAHAGTVAALRAMFNDALEDGLCDVNPFAKLGLDQSRGREGIVVLTREELGELAQLAHRMHGPAFGSEMAAMILWAAYTCMRPGETFAARDSLLDGDTYDLRRQFNSTLGGRRQPRPAKVAGTLGERDQQAVDLQVIRSNRSCSHH